MEPTLFRFIWKHSLKQQLLVLLLTALSMPAFYYSLDLPKTIINQAIQGRNFPRIEFGFSFDQLQYLMLLSGTFLALVLINGGFKYYINSYKTRVGERMLRRLRYELYDRLLRFPLGFFGRTAPGEVIPIITSEVEPLGGFIGDSFAVPALQGGQLLTILAFMFIQDPLLALAAIALYPVQIYVIPKLQARVNQLTKQRVRMIRSMSDRINESAVTLQEIRAHGAAKYHLAEFAHRLARNYTLRVEIAQKKFFIKFLNNFIAQLTPFFFYAIGGYLVIRGSLSFGALVAMLAAYKDLSPPWRELLDYYQTLKDSEIRYEQIIEQFEPAGSESADRHMGGHDEADALTPELAVASATWVNDAGAKALDGVTLTIRPGEHVAVVGPESGGKYELGLLLSGLVDATAGQVTLGGKDLAQIPRAAIARRIAYVGQNTALFAGSFFDNLVVGLQVRPNPADPVDAAALARRRIDLAEAAMTGNSPDDIEADWIDYAAAGAKTRAELKDRIIACLGVTELVADLRELGLRGTIDPAERPDIADVMLRARRALKEQLSGPQLRGYFEMFDADRFNDQASIAENLLFGTPVGPMFDVERLAESEHVRSVLDRLGLTDRWVEIGQQIAGQMIEMFSGLPPGHELFQRYSFIGATELPDYAAAVQRVQRPGTTMTDEERRAFLALVFRIVPARHRFDMVDEAFRSQVLEARQLFSRELPDALRPNIQFFDADRYNSAVSLYDNMLFGRLAPGQANTGSRARQMIAKALADVGLMDEVMGAVVDVGLAHEVGVGGSRLTGGMRQKLAIARALLKRPDILILNDPVAVLETSAQSRIVTQVIEASPERTVVWALQRAQLARQFDRLVVMSDGRVAEQGRFQDLDRPNSILQKLQAD